MWPGMNRWASAFGRGGGGAEQRVGVDALGTRVCECVLVDGLCRSSRNLDRVRGSYDDG